MEWETAGQKIAEDVISVSHEDLAQSIDQELLGNSSLLPIIKEKILHFLDTVEKYENNPKGIGTIGQQLTRLRNQKEFIYAEFFEIQNLINAFLGQRIVMTYVHVDDEGRREIRISDNDISHLGITRGTMWNGNPFYKLGYNVESHYQTLKNSLPREDNEALQTTAMEVERRYMEYKKRVLWYYPNTWKGYQFRTKGPINEAFVDLYVHNIQLRNSLEGNIDTFMLGDHGAIKADATKGFLIGDVSKDGVQYAVKGIFGSPQGTKDIIKAFRKIVDEDFSVASFHQFLYKYTEEELQKNYKPQIAELSQRSVNAILRHIEKAVQNKN